MRTTVPSKYESVEAWFTAVKTAKQTSKLERWRFFEVIVDDGVVKLLCTDCGAKLSSKNISSSLNAHIKLVGGSLCCITRSTEQQKLSVLVSSSGTFAPHWASAPHN
jgi:hypothetical protein